MAKTGWVRLLIRSIPCDEVIKSEHFFYLRHLCKHSVYPWRLAYLPSSDNLLPLTATSSVELMHYDSKINGFLHLNYGATTAVERTVHALCLLVLQCLP